MTEATEGRRLVLIAKGARAVLGFIGLLVVGALGNGVWEWFLRDVVLWVANSSLRAVSLVWSGYVDALHRGIGSTLSTDLLVSALAMTFWLLLPWSAVAVAHYVHQVEKGNPYPRPPRLFGHQGLGRARWLTVVAILFVGVAFMAIVQSDYRRRAAIWAERSIEIVAPNITERERLQLRAELRAVGSGLEFYRLYDHLRSLQPAAGLRLPPFEPIGYTSTKRP